MHIVKKLKFLLISSIQKYVYKYYTNLTAELQKSIKADMLRCMLNNQCNHTIPVPRTRTTRYRSFINHVLTHYQPKLK